MSEFNQNPSDDQLEAYRLHRCAGMPQAEVATRFGVTQQCVSKWVALVRDYLRFAMREQLSSLRAELTERWEYLYVESLRAWRRSQEPEIVTTRKSEAGTESKTTRETPQVGSPAFLKLAQEALGGIANLWEADMSAADRRGESRTAGKTQSERIDAKIAELQRAKLKLLNQQNGGGAGDKA